MREGERASFGPWQEGGVVRPSSQGTEVWGELRDRGVCVMERSSLSSTALWLLLELGQQQCTENVNQMQVEVFMQQHRLETAFDKKCWVFRAKG